MWDVCQILLGYVRYFHGQDAHSYVHAMRLDAYACKCVNTPDNVHQHAAINYQH